MTYRRSRAVLAALGLAAVTLAPVSATSAPARATDSCDTHHNFQVCVSYLGGTFYGTVFNRGGSATPGNGHLVITDQEDWSKSKDVHVAPGDTATIKYKAGKNGHACVGWYYPSSVVIAPWSACIN